MVHKKAASKDRQTVVRTVPRKVDSRVVMTAPTTVVLMVLDSEHTSVVTMVDISAAMMADMSAKNLDNLKVVLMVQPMAAK